jgi:predicted hydrocarbon binding protein
MAQSKGTIYLSVEKFVIERWGEDALQECLREMPEEDRKVLHEVLAVGWYPLEPVILFHRIVDWKLGNGDLALVQEIGRYSAEWQLNAFHMLVLRFKTPKWLLNKAAQMWSRYHESGEWEVDEPEPQTIVGRLYGFEVADACFCTRETGWFERAVELTGGKNVQITEPRCRSRGDSHCEWRGTYDL